MEAVYADLNLMGYRVALALVGVLAIFWAPPRPARMPKLRAAGWACVVYGLTLLIGFLEWDRTHGRNGLFEYGVPLIVMLLGVASLEETGRFRLRRALAAARALNWRHLVQLLLTGSRTAGWILLVPAFAAALPWWLALPPVLRDFGRFMLFYILAGVCFTVSDVGGAALRRHMGWREVVNRPLGAGIVDLVLFGSLCLTFVALDPEDPPARQAAVAGLITGLAVITWYVTYRWARVRMGLPPMEVPTIGWIWRRIVTGYRRRRFRPDFRLREDGPYLIVEGPVPDVPLDYLRVEVLPRRITVTVAEPLDVYSPWGGWTGVAPLPRTVEPSAAKATLAEGHLTVTAPRKYGVDLWD